MKRITSTKFYSDAGRELVEITPERKAKVAIFSCDAEELGELAVACAAAADELHAMLEADANDGVSVRIAE